MKILYFFVATLVGFHRFYLYYLISIRHVLVTCLSVNKLRLSPLIKKTEIRRMTNKHRKTDNGTHTMQQTNVHELKVKGKYPLPPIHPGPISQTHKRLHISYGRDLNKVPFSPSCYCQLTNLQCEHNFFFIIHSDKCRHRI